MQRADYYQMITGMMNNQPFQWPQRMSDDESAEFIDYAQQHGVLALLSHFQHHLDDTDWPPFIKQSIAIANQASKQILKDRKITVIAIFEAFEKNTINALIFKGAANAYLLYEQPHHRTHADVDILIREADFHKVKTSLSALGFEFDAITPTQYGPSQCSGLLEQQGKTPVNIDIHWKINNRLTLANAMEFDEVNPRAIPIEEYEGKARAFSYADAVLAASIHEAGSLDSEKGKLISLYDVNLLLQKLNAQEIQTVTKIACEKNIGQITSQYISKCLGTFEDEALASKVNMAIEKTEVPQDELSAQLLNNNRSWLTDQWLDLRSVDGTLAKVGFILSKLNRKFR